MKKGSFTILPLAIAASILVGCGGSSGGSNTEKDNGGQQPPGDSNPPVVETQTLTGKTADGYLSNAIAFLDFNGNAELDGDEPQVTTDEAGQFEFTELSKDLDLETVRVVVNAIAGQTIDLDSGVAVDTDFTLTSPAGYTSFVSPITTLVDVQLQNSTLTIGEVISKSQGLLSVDDVALDLMADYVAGSDSSDASLAKANKKVHHVAQIVTSLVANNIAALEQVGVNQAKIEILHAVNDYIYSNVGEVVVAAENVLVAEDKQAALAESLENLKDMAVSSEKVQQIIEDLAERHELTRETASDVFSKDGGVYFLDASRDRELIDNVCYEVLTLGRTNLIVSDGAFSISESELDALSMMFESYTEQLMPVATLGANGWEQETSQSITLKGYGVDDISAILSIPGSGEVELRFEGKDIDGLSFKRLEDIPTFWFEAQNNLEQKFTASTGGYVATVTQAEDYYAIPQNTDCVADPDCNVVFDRPSNRVMGNMDMLFNESTQVAFPNDRGWPLSLRLRHSYEAGEEIKSGRVYMSHVEGGEGSLIGQFAVETVNGERMVVLHVDKGNRDYWHEDASHIFIAQQGNNLRWGYKIAKENIGDKEMAFDAQAMEELFDGVDSAKLMTETTNEDCPDYVPEFELTDELIMEQLQNKTYYYSTEQSEVIYEFRNGYLEAHETNTVNALTYSMTQGDFTVEDGVLKLYLGDDVIEQTITAFNEVEQLKVELADGTAIHYTRLRQVIPSSSQTKNISMISSDERECQVDVSIGVFGLLEGPGTIAVGSCNETFDADIDETVDVLFKLSGGQLTFAEVIPAGDVNDNTGVLYESWDGDHQRFLVRYEVKNESGDTESVLTWFDAK